MARIPDEVVERLKREVSVERIAEAKGIELKRHGENLVGRCPFHDDRTPIAGGHAEQEPLALHGRVPGGRDGDRLRDAAGAVLVSCCVRDAAEGRSLFSCLAGSGPAADDDGASRGDRKARRAGRGGAAPRGGLLSRDA